MTFEIETPSRTRVVQIAGAPGGYDVTVDGARRTVDAVRVGGGAWSMLIGPAEAGHRAARSYEVAVAEPVPGELSVYVRGRLVPVRVGGPSRLRRRGPAGADARSGPQRVAAPMPGRVVRVLVKAGDAVQARQGLVVVEAMKMENELRASRAGTVTEVRVAEGASVEANAVLVVIE